MQHSIFGCKVNKFYLNKWLSYFSQRGFDNEQGHLMATCVVTDRAKAKRVKEAKKILADGSDLYLTGCGAFEKGEAMDYEQFFSIYPELLPWKSTITLLGEDPTAQSDLGDIGLYPLNREIGFEEQATLYKKSADERHKKRLFTKKFIVIQSGCDTYCTFCLTIYKRGSNRNRPMEEIIDEIKEFVALGGKEIVITGVNLAARGASHTRKIQENKFSSLLRAIIQRTAIERIRISSLGPEFLDDEFFALMSDQRFLPHFHFSIQHFDSQVLARMNRNYDFARLDEVLTRIRNIDRPDRDYISLGADLIVGFPGETPEAFALLCDSVKKYKITKMHAFPFSPHQKGESVPAGSLPNQIPQPVKRERMTTLLALGEQVRNDFLEQNKGKKRPVLIEGSKNSSRTGRTGNYIQLSGPENYKRGSIVEVEL